MLSPGDQVFLDGEEKRGLQGRRWTVRAAARADDLPHLTTSSLDCQSFYQFVDWPTADEWVPASRITAHWVQS
jgi:hypothetical protein